LYTPSFGSIYSFPIVGGLLDSMRRRCLITVWEPQLRTKAMVGDIEIKGVNTRNVEQMEYVSDELFEYDFEMRNLSDEVDRITLADNLAMLPTRIRKAIDSNSEHNKSLDLKDTQVPVAE
jgi:methyl coenzyme M reductase subunit D